MGRATETSGGELGPHLGAPVGVGGSGPRGNVSARPQHSVPGRRTSRPHPPTSRSGRATVNLFHELLLPHPTRGERGGRRLVPYCKLNLSPSRKLLCREATLPFLYNCLFSPNAFQFRKRVKREGPLKGLHRSVGPTRSGKGSTISLDPTRQKTCPELLSSVFGLLKTIPTRSGLPTNLYQLKS